MILMYSSGGSKSKYSTIIPVLNRVNIPRRTITLIKTIRIITLYILMGNDDFNFNSSY